MFFTRQSFSSVLLTYNVQKEKFILNTDYVPIP